ERPALQVNGQRNGGGDGTTPHATTAADASLVPGHVSGNAVSSSTWPELFFPAGTTSGVTEATFGYYYNAQVKTTTIVCSGRRHHRQQCTHQTTVQNQHWADTYNNGDGQLPADGNITG